MMMSWLTRCRIGLAFALIVIVGVQTTTATGAPTLGQKNAARVSLQDADGDVADPAAAGSVPTAEETPAQRDARMAWWREAKFGLFIHWGVYAVPAGQYGKQAGYGEWIMHQGQISVAEYKGFAEKFNPVKYNPTTWAQLAREAGMRYVVITAKHHDGFALFPSAASSWNVVEASPYKKDLLGPLVDAVRAEGLKMGFYYSHSQDWVNPGGHKRDYTGEKSGTGWDPAQAGNFDNYLKTVAVPQVRELLTRWQPDVLWYDMQREITPERAAPLNALKSLRPGLITNDRLGGGFKGDTKTAESYVPVLGFTGDWEACMTLNRHWGYNAADQDWKSTCELLHKLATICSRGGNFLLNIGPTAEGEFPPACVERLREIGQWMKVNSEAIYGTQAGPFNYLPWGVATRKGQKLYLHVFEWPKDGKLRVPLQSPVTRATLLALPDKKLTVTSTSAQVVVTVPATAPDLNNSVVVLELGGEPVAVPIPSLGATATASAETRGNEAAFSLDGSAAKGWLPPAGDKSAWLEVDLGKPKAICAIGVDEPKLPRQVKAWLLEVQVGDGWVKVAAGETEGRGFIQSFTPVTGQKFRLTLSSATGSLGVAELQLYAAEDTR